MKDLWIVAKYTAKEMLKRKSFLISNFIILLLIVVGFNVPNIMNSFKGENSQEEEQNQIVVIDSENILGKEMIESLNETDITENFKVIEKNIDLEEWKQKVNQNEIEGIILLYSKDNMMEMEYIVDSLGMGGNTDEIMTLFNELYQNKKMQMLGLDFQEIAQIKQPIKIQVTELKEGTSGGMLFAAMMLCIVLFYAIYFCAYQVSSSITTEKTSKIMETLVTSTSPKMIVLGKTFGIGLVGLLQIAAILLVTFISYQVFLPEGILEGFLDVSKITPTFVIMIIVYFILGYSLYSLLYALTGSTVSKPEDINSANSPVALLAVVGFYLAYFSMMNPTSSINTFASIFPFSAPFSMPFRFIGNTVTTGEIIASLGVMVVTILIIANIAIKIYSNAILHYGTKLNIKDILKM